MSESAMHSYYDDTSSQSGIRVIENVLKLYSFLIPSTNAAGDMRGETLLARIVFSYVGGSGTKLLGQGRKTEK